MANIQLHNCDCLEFMANVPDKHFDLAICDPPYGIGEDGKKNHSRGNKTNSKKYTPKEWDSKPPKKEYFEELKRVSKNQIIWGANHFVEKIPNANTSCWIVWDKENGGNDFADCELAWTSFNTAVRKFKFRWNGMLQGDMKNKQIRIHPTEKPVKLYEWLLKNYTKEGDVIFDPNFGSASSAIAAHNLGFDFEGCEIDQEYFEKAQQRFNLHASQSKLF